MTKAGNPPITDADLARYREWPQRLRNNIGPRTVQTDDVSAQTQIIPVLEALLAEVDRLRYELDEIRTVSAHIQPLPPKARVELAEGLERLRDRADTITRGELKLTLDHFAEELRCDHSAAKRVYVLWEPRSNNMVATYPTLSEAQVWRQKFHEQDRSWPWLLLWEECRCGRLGPEHRAEP